MEVLLERFEDCSSALDDSSVVDEVGVRFEVVVDVLCDGNGDTAGGGLVVDDECVSSSVRTIGDDGQGML